MGPMWVADTKRAACFHCHAPFSWRLRRHHCRCCGELFCAKCCPLREAPEWIVPSGIEEDLLKKVDENEVALSVCPGCAAVIQSAEPLVDGKGTARITLRRCSLLQDDGTWIDVEMEGPNPVYKVALVKWRPFARSTAFRFTRVLDVADGAAAETPVGPTPTQRGGLAAAFAAPPPVNLISITDTTDTASDAMMSTASAIKGEKRGFRFQMSGRGPSSRQLPTTFEILLSNAILRAGGGSAASSDGGHSVTVTTKNERLFIEPQGTDGDGGEMIRAAKFEDMVASLVHMARTRNHVRVTKVVS